MARIEIHNWKVVGDNDQVFEFVPPEYHTLYWEIPKWWWQGERAVYTSCARVDYLKEYEIYIDGTKPSMNIIIYADGNNIYFDKAVAVDRVLICRDVLPVNRRETDEYIDIDFTLPRDGYIVRWDGLDPLKVIDWGEITVENYFNCREIHKLPTLDSNESLAPKSTKILGVCTNIPLLPTLDEGLYSFINQLPTIDNEHPIESQLTTLFGKSVDIDSLPVLSNAYSA